MNFVYHGEPFIVEQKVNELKSEIDNGDANSTNINIFDANEVNPDNFLNACYSMPFLSSKRLVIIKGLLSIFESTKSSRGRFNPTKQTSKSKKSSEWDSIAEEIPKFPNTTLLIFLDFQLSDNNKFLNKIRPHVKINYFPQPNGNELIKWIKGKASSKSCQIEERAIVELLRYTENDIRKIDSELEKLALYNPTDTITLKDVENLVIPISNPNLFTSIDAILTGNKKYALNSLIGLMNQGTPAQLIIAILGKQIRNLILIKSLINLGLPNKELIKRIPISSYALQKLTRIQNKISLISLQNMHKVLIDADYKTKTTNTQADLVIELVIIELSHYALSEAKP